ncbi:MAG: ATP-binding protein [Flavobacteriaceae bacterium]|nr:ATP-binding protein [Flavobacteriaceae bacterium]|tara:strand:+ start:632 stop:1324 length:693 start_codon:yes stop_codon:yes gene_type:complete
MIEIYNITKKYSKDTVLDVLKLDIPDGQTFGLVGNNGAGKTTLFSCLLDLVKPTTGKITNNGVDVKDSEEWKKFTTAFLDESFLIGYLLPEEYFYFIGELRGLRKKQIDDFLLKFEEFFNGEIIGKKKYLRDLSKGNQKKAGIVAALIGDPKVVVLDEPFANLDPSTQIRLKQIIKELSSSGTTVLVSSHDLQDVTEVCKRIVLLEKGRVINDINTSNKTLSELESYFKS